MEDGGPGSWLLLIVLLAADAVVYGFGASVRSIRREEDPEEKPKEDADSRAKKRRERLRRILADQSDYVDSVQNITACVNVILGMVYARRLGEFLRRVLPASHPTVFAVLAYVLSVLLVLVLIGTFGVQIPRRLAAAHPERWADRYGAAFQVLMVLFLPLTRVIGWFSRGILFLCGVRGTPLKGDVTEEEIRSIVHEGHEQGVIEQTEAEMITNIFEFSDKEARDIMTNRSDIVSIDGRMRLQDAVRMMLEQHNSRFPVYRDNIDTITGIVHMRDALEYRELHPQEGNRPIGEIREVLREAIYVPETKSIDDLFRQMQKEKAQLVIVIDEYGQTSGIVAMEDILEEIVGNIMDEYDVDENYITPTGNRNEYIVDGRTPLEDVEKKLGIHFEDDRFETVNGLMMSLMDSVPAPDCHYETKYQGYRLKVLSVADRQVQKVLFTRIQPALQSQTQT